MLAERHTRMRRRGTARHTRCRWGLSSSMLVWPTKVSPAAQTHYNSGTVQWLYSVCCLVCFARVIVCGNSTGTRNHTELDWTKYCMRPTRSCSRGRSRRADRERAIEGDGQRNGNSGRRTEGKPAGSLQERANLRWIHTEKEHQKGKTREAQEGKRERG